MRRVAAALVVLAAGCGGADERPRGAAEVIRGDLDLSYFVALDGGRRDVGRATLLLNHFVVDHEYDGFQRDWANLAGRYGELAGAWTDASLAVYVVRGEGDERLGERSGEVAGWTGYADTQLEIDRLLAHDRRRSLGRLPDYLRSTRDVVRDGALVTVYDPNLGAAAVYGGGRAFTSDTRGYHGGATVEPYDLERLLRLAPPDAAMVVAWARRESEMLLGVPLLYESAQALHESIYEVAKGAGIFWPTEAGDLTIVSTRGGGFESDPPRPRLRVGRSLGFVTATTAPRPPDLAPGDLPEWLPDDAPEDAVRYVWADMQRLARAAEALAGRLGKRPQAAELAVARQLDTIYLYDTLEGDVIRSRGAYRFAGP